MVLPIKPILRKSLISFIKNNDEAMPYQGTGAWSSKFLVHSFIGWLFERDRCFSRYSVIDDERPVSKGYSQLITADPLKLYAKNTEITRERGFCARLCRI